MSNTEHDIIKEKILNSNYEFKKKLLNEDLIKEITLNLKDIPEIKIDELINTKINDLKNPQMNESELERLECELALLLSNRKINMQEAHDYWKETEKNARRK